MVSNGRFSIWNQRLFWNINLDQTAATYNNNLESKGLKSCQLLCFVRKSIILGCIQNIVNWCRHLSRSGGSAKHRYMVGLPCILSQCAKFHVAGWTWAVKLWVLWFLKSQCGIFWKHPRIAEWVHTDRLVHKYKITGMDKMEGIRSQINWSQ
jgi:hypothetical protein